MRPKRDFRTGSKENYKKYKERYPKSEITFSDYKKLLKAYNSLILTHILDTGDTVKIPWGFGDVTILRYKKDIQIKTSKDGDKFYTYCIDWKRTKEKGKYVYHTNLHTGGYNYYWRWENEFSKLPYKKIWSFRVMRDFKRELTRRLTKEVSTYKDLYRSATYKNK